MDHAVQRLFDPSRLPEEWLIRNRRLLQASWYQSITFNLKVKLKDQLAENARTKGLSQSFKFWER